MPGWDVLVAVPLTRIPEAIDPPDAPKLLHRLRSELRARHYSPRTEQAYVLWTRRFVRFHGMRHPGDMGEEEVNRFVTHLAVERHVSPSTQTQALSAILFLYRHVLGRRLGDLGSLVRARKQRRLPVVLSQDASSRTVWTSARCRSFWATPISRPPCSTRMC